MYYLTHLCTKWEKNVLKASTCEIVLPVASSLEKQVHAQVVKSNVEADDVLFTGLVGSGVKSGRVYYARRVFDMMLEKNVVCSTSMISGYMNQGFVEEAEYIFKRTQEKDVVVYNAMIEGYNKSLETALLSACRLHDDVELANIAANEIFKLSNDGRPGAYVELSYTLAASGKWNSVSEVRDLMKVRGVSKDTGCSWVGTDSGLEGFHVGQKM
ncbi:hypothetical protein U1Q18_025263 [Sarracenia purpurea var. burkii]